MKLLFMTVGFIFTRSDFLSVFGMFKFIAESSHFDRPLHRESEGHRPLELTTFFISETNFLTKLSHRFGIFRLHGGLGSTSAPAYNGQGVTSL